MPRKKPANKRSVKILRALLILAAIFGIICSIKTANAPLSQKPEIKKTAKFVFEGDGNLIAVLH